MLDLRDRIHDLTKGDREWLDPLEDILCRFYSLRTTKPHDKIYALLGLATGAWTSVITPDYARPAPAVYLDVMKAMFGTRTDFCMLGFAGLAASQPLLGNLPEIPSWVPGLHFSTTPQRVVEPVSAIQCHWPAIHARSPSPLGRFLGC